MLAFMFRDSVPTIASSATNANNNPKWKYLSRKSVLNKFRSYKESKRVK
jgi:hypothetical protein